MEKYIDFLEEVSLNAWPSHKSEFYDGWLLRFSANYTHRTNSAYLIAPSTLPVDEKIKYCEQEYKHAGTPSIFKISPTQDPAFDNYLDKLGYVIEHKANVMTLDFKDFKERKIRNNTILSDTITDEWIHNLFHLNGTTDIRHLEIVPSMYKAIPNDTIVARIDLDGKMIASGLGILERDHVGLYAIYVDKNYRSLGYGKQICEAILSKAHCNGIGHAYLQVVYENTTAQHLYETLGFKYLYTYWFRVKHF